MNEQLSKLRCRLGFHSLAEVRIWELRLDIACAYLTGRRCADCGRIHPDDAFQVERLENRAIRDGLR